MVIDDDFRSTEPVVDFLKASGFEVSYASNGGRAIQIARKDKPDLVLLDLLMPGMNGMEVLRLLRSELPATAIIIMSGIREEDAMRQALAAGAQDYLVKPFSLEKLQTTVIPRFFR